MRHKILVVSVHFHSVLHLLTRASDVVPNAPGWHSEGWFSLPIQIGVVWFLRRHMKFCSNFWTQSVVKSSVHIYVAKQFRDTGNFFFFIQTRVTVFQRASAAGPCRSCRRQPAGRWLDWTEGDGSAVAVLQRLGSTDQCTFHVQETLLTNKYIIMRLIPAPQCLNLLSSLYICFPSWKLFSVCCYKCCF